MAQSDVPDSAKDAVYAATKGPVKSFFAVLFAPVVRTNEIERKAIVALAGRQDAFVDQMDNMADRLFAIVGVSPDKIGIQHAVASQPSARDTIYQPTESWWKTGLGILVPGLGGTLRSNEVLKKALVASTERYENQMEIVNAKLDDIAAALNVDTSQIGAKKAGFPSQKSVKESVKDATYAPGKTAGALVLGSAVETVGVGLSHIPPLSFLTSLILPFSSAGYLLRKNQVTRAAVNAAAEHRHEQAQIMYAKMEKIAETLGVNLDDIIDKNSPAFTSGEDAVKKATKGQVETGAAMATGGIGLFFRENQVVRQAISAAGDIQELQLGVMTKAMNALIQGASAKANPGKPSAQTQAKELAHKEGAEFYNTQIAGLEGKAAPLREEATLVNAAASRASEQAAKQAAEQPAISTQQTRTT